MLVGRALDSNKARPHNDIDRGAYGRLRESPIYSEQYTSHPVFLPQPLAVETGHIFLFGSTVLGQ